MTKQPIKYLPNGHSVLYKFLCKSKKILPKDDDWGKVPTKRIGDYFYVKGFIAGDTEEKGISLLAQDDESICLIALTMDNSDRSFRNKIRELLRSGGVSVEEMEKLPQSFRLRLGEPQCPYSSRG